MIINLLKQLSRERHRSSIEESNADISRGQWAQATHLILATGEDHYNTMSLVKRLHSRSVETSWTLYTWLHTPQWLDIVCSCATSTPIRPGGGKEPRRAGLRSPDGRQKENPGQPGNDNFPAPTPPDSMFYFRHQRRPQRWHHSMSPDAKTLNHSFPFLIAKVTARLSQLARGGRNFNL